MPTNTTSHKWSDLDAPTMSLEDLEWADVIDWIFAQAIELLNIPIELQDLNLWCAEDTPTYAPGLEAGDRELTYEIRSPGPTLPGSRRQGLQITAVLASPAGARRATMTRIELRVSP